MRRFRRFGILLIAACCGCVATGDRRVDVTTPQADIARHDRDADAQRAMAAAGEPADRRHAVVRVFYGTDRARRLDAPAEVGDIYSGQRGHLDFGVCHVSIPEDDPSQEKTPPEIWRFEFREENGAQALLLDTQPVDRAEFARDLTSDVTRSGTGDVFVFVHAGDADFAEAVRQTARIAHNLRFDGPPLLYSWPTEAELSGGRIDQTAALQLQSHLVRFLESVTHDSGAGRVHLIAHGTGTRLVAGALRHMSESSLTVDQKHFHEVILADPDLDAESFSQEIAARMIRVVDRVTIYVRDDDADLHRPARLSASDRPGPRALQAVNFPDVPGIDVVDVADQDLRFLDGRGLLGDIRQVFDGAATTQRGLQPHPSRRPSWRLPASEVRFVSHSNDDATEDEPGREEVTESDVKAGLWSRVTGWWPW